MIRPLIPSALALLIAVSSSGPSLAAGQQGSPFSPYVGLWAGLGTVHSATGDKAATCHATQTARGDVGQLDLFCISGTVGLDLSISLQAFGGSLQGSWRENVSGNQGTLTGKVGNRVLTTLAKSDGNDFSIVIQAPADQKILRVGVATSSSFLTRGSIVLQPTTDDVGHFAQKLQSMMQSQGGDQ